MKLGPYEIVGPIGTGGMGEVYRGRDAKLDRDVAIKVLPSNLTTDPAALERLEREAKALAATSHPNILSIFDFGASGGVTYAVMELLDGDTLRGLLASGALPQRKAVDYAVQIAEGLGAAHDRSITHRDLKPENVFVTRDGRVKILDFGLARQHVVLSADGATALAHQTEPGTVLGTVGYMSPEQVRGEPADARSDIFSFGVVLFEMLSGRRAFKRDSAAETLHAILRDDPPDLLESGRGLSPALDRIVAHCLEKSPDQRFQSARDVAFNLKSLSTLSSGSRSGLVGEVPKPRRRPALIAIALVGLGAIAGGMAVRTIGKMPPVEPPLYRRLTFDRGTVGQARFAPDGQTVVYNAAWRGQPSEIFTTRFDGRESRPLGLGQGVLMAVSSTSELAIAMGTDFAFIGATLGRVPLAGGALKASVENVSFADWPSDGGADLAVVRIADKEQRIEFPIGKVLYRTTDSLSHLRVSPAGDWVAFAQHPADAPYSRGSLIAVDRTGRKKVLSSGWTDLWGVAWRPDGREVWFTAAKGPVYKALWAVTLDGQTRLVTRMLGQVDLLDISRDGRVLMTQTDFRDELMARPPAAPAERVLTWLALSALADLSVDSSRVLFTELNLGGGSGESVYLRSTDGAPAVRLGTGDALSLSPDGKWALATLSPPTRLFALPTGAGEARELTRAGFDYAPSVPPIGKVRWGVWFPDSHHIIFNAAQHDGPLRLFVQDIEGGEPRAVGPTGVIGAGVSPNGRSVVAGGPNRPTIIFPLEGGEPAAFKGLQAGERPIRWSLDGRSLICRHDVGHATEVSAVEIATGRHTLLWRLAAADAAGAEPVNTIAVTPDGRSYAYSFFRNVSDLYMVEGLR
jgi:hypothetical protein